MMMSTTTTTMTMGGHCEDDIEGEDCRDDDDEEYEGHPYNERYDRKDIMNDGADTGRNHEQVQASNPLPGTTSSDPLSEIYTKDFFEQFRAYGDACPALARAISSLVPEDASIVDIGCGHGFLVEALRASGLTESYGVEGSISGATLWPKQYSETFYKIQDLTAKDAARSIPETDFVSTLEVAEHLPPSHAQHFVRLLTRHRPRLVFFGAATSFQDRGRNPGHLNEQPISYWVRRFEKEGYALDAARSATFRVGLLLDEGYKQALQTGKAWWFVKNAVVFADVDWEIDEDEEEGGEYFDEDRDADEGRAAMDDAVANAPWE